MRVGTEGVPPCRVVGRYGCVLNRGLSLDANTAEHLGKGAVSSP